jgi:hypothetical protein
MATTRSKTLKLESQESKWSVECVDRGGDLLDGTGTPVPDDPADALWPRFELWRGFGPRPASPEVIGLGAPGPSMSRDALLLRLQSHVSADQAEYLLEQFQVESEGENDNVLPKFYDLPAES